MHNKDDGENIPCLVVHRCKLRLVFWMETKGNINLETRSKRDVSFDCCVSVSSSGKGDGLMLLWNMDDMMFVYPVVLTWSH